MSDDHPTTTTGGAEPPPGAPAAGAGGAGTAQPGPPDPADARDRWVFGLGSVGIGVLALLIAYVVFVLKGSPSTGATALGAIASPIAAMVAAYFGVQASTSAAKDSQASAKTAQKAAQDSQANAQSAHEQKSAALAQAASALTALEMRGHGDDADAIRSRFPSGP